MDPRVVIEDGILNVDGRRTFVWSADYPYYRDQRADWSRQLDNLKRMNVEVVTFYLSWRHHAPVDPLRDGGAYDFTGQHNDRTDVIEFVRLIREKGLSCIVKPGPYIHAETRYGSLPDYVLPDHNPRIGDRRDMRGDPVPGCWGFARPPAPLHPEYLPYVRGWFRAVAEEIIRPNEYPNGPILAVQVLNEGVYSDGHYPVDSFNFEESSAAHYAGFLREKYGSIDLYNEACGTGYRDFRQVAPPGPWGPGTTRASVRPWIDWSEFGRYFYRLIASTYIGYLREAGVTLPVVMNINPPGATGGAGLETSLGRYTVPYLGGVMQYGYTNWCGVVSHDPEAYLRYKIVGKVARGINMEENWGFDSYDPPHYWSVQPSLFQSLAYMLWGATGLNIYLGVSCDCWTDDLAVDAGGVYMHNHPIAEDGSYRTSFWTCHQLGALLRHVGNDLVSQEKDEPVAWALYSPYAHAAGWNGSPEEWRKAGFSTRPAAASPGWMSFMALCEKYRTPNGICYPAEEPVEKLLRHRVLFMGGADWMDAATQEKLVAYVERGGVLVLTGAVPERDEFFRPRTTLKEALFPVEVSAPAERARFEYELADGGFSGSSEGLLRTLGEPGDGLSPLAFATDGGERRLCGVLRVRGKGKAVFLGFTPWQTETGDWGSTGLVEHLARHCAGVSLDPPVPHPDDALVEVAEYRCDARGRHYVYVLSRREHPSTLQVRLGEAAHPAAVFETALPARSGALVGLEGDRIAAAYVRGFNDHDQSAVPPRVQTQGDLLSARDPCDLYFCRRDDGACELSIANVQTPDGCTTVVLPLRPPDVAAVEQVTSSGRARAVRVLESDGHIALRVSDMRRVNGEGGEWSPGYVIRPTR